jgi:hypothetical protein
MAAAAGPQELPKRIQKETENLIKVNTQRRQRARRWQGEDALAVSRFWLSERVARAGQ